jgi:hypothetical protein
VKAHFLNERNREVLNVAHIDDISKILRTLQMEERFSSDLIKCKFCKTVVNKRNLYSLIPKSGAAILVCDKPECIMRMNEYLAGSI